LTERLFKILTLFSLVAFMLIGCEDDNYISSDNARLTLSSDSLVFDTIFTTIGSTTKSFRVINQHNQPILISSIQLAGLDESAYRLNIDGEMANEAENIELAANDSIYIFVELTVDPNGSNQPMIVQDSIVFITNKNVQNINLLAWGQDFHPIKTKVIETTTWTNDKPYLIYDYVLVDSNAVLTIEPGTKIYFHKDAVLAALGTINATGTPTMPIEFSGDRLEAMYEDIPDQWYGILLYSNNNTTHLFENVNIKNARIGLQAGTIEYEGMSNVVLHNTRIEHMGYAGLFAIKGNIKATNTLIADCGNYLALLAGGSYDFTHCTLANYWSGYSNRQTASVAITNQLIIPQGNDTIAHLVKANWNNSIIWGNLSSEIEFGHNKDYAFNYNFKNSLVKISDSVYNARQENFESSLINLDPLFVDYAEYDYQLDSLSPAIDAGLVEYGEMVTFDLNNNDRLSDEQPDIGAYERIIENED
jgi:hypothetical protein